MSDEHPSFPRPGASYRTQTVGPFYEDWAVVDDRGEVVYQGDAVLAARAAAELRRLASDS
jgi:hypothetical protein